METLLVSLILAATGVISYAASKGALSLLLFVMGASGSSTEGGPDMR
jgi:hypothetical protein